MVTITGTNFVPTSTVTYNSMAHTVTYISATSLTHPLNAADLATAGSYPVVVTNPAPARGSSSPVNFTVGTAPSITSANHATFIAGTNSQFQVTATGNPAPTFAVTAGTLPSGLTITPAVSSAVRPTAANSSRDHHRINGLTPNATQSLTIQVNESPFIDNTTTSVSAARDRRFRSSSPS